MTGPEVILVVGDWSSKCSACGKNADPGETSHKHAYADGKGCGAKFTHIPLALGARVAHYTDPYANLHRLNPDLPIKKGWRG